MAFGGRSFTHHFDRLAIFLLVLADVADTFVAIKRDGGDVLLGHFGREHADAFLLLGDVIPDLLAEIGGTGGAAQQGAHIVRCALADDDLLQILRLAGVAARIDDGRAACQQQRKADRKQPATNE